MMNKETNRKLQRHRTIYLRRLASYERGLEKRIYKILNRQSKFTAGQYQTTDTILRSDLSKHTGELRELLTKYYVTVGTVLGAAAVLNMKQETPLERELRIWAIERAAASVATIEDTTWKHIQTAIQVANNDGLGVASTARLIREATSGQIAAARARTISRTELHTAANVAAEQVANSTGLTLKKTWVSAQADRTRSTHRAANGQTVDMDQPFNVGGYSLMHPGDTNAPASEVINCRCTTVYVPA